MEGSNKGKITQVMKTLIQTSPIISKTAHILYGSYHSLGLKINDANLNSPVVVYQMGKVGSSTVIQSLHQVKPSLNLYHVHYLSDSKIREVMEKTNFPHRSIAPKDHWVSRYLRRRMLKKPDERWKVISLIREPIARNISAFFQNAHWLYPDLVERSKRGDLSIDELISVFLEKYPHDIPLTWFDDELNAALGIDVFKNDFLPEKGMAIYSNKRVDVLLLRMESLSNCGEKGIGDFLGIKNFRLKNANVGESKQYSSLYEAFKRVILLPESYIKHMYDSKYAKHFYTTTELESFAKKWQKPNE